jgi:hypothetical protein
MYERDSIITCASGLVGWRQSQDPAHTQLDSILQQSRSGYYVNDLPGVDFDYMEETLDWKKTKMNTYLNFVWMAEIVRLVDKVVARSKQETGVKELLANYDVVGGRANFNDVVTGDARFVGWLIAPNRSNNLRAEITHIGMQIDTVQTNPVRIYLYESSQRIPIATYDYSNSTEYSLEWKEMVDFIVSYRSEQGGTGQTFLLGYYETDPANVQTTQLEGNALYVKLCEGCSHESKRKKIYNEHIRIVPVAIPNDYLQWNAVLGDYDLPLCDDYEDHVCEDHTFGLMLKLNIVCDVTEVICKNIMMFAPALQYSIAVRVLWDAVTSVKINAMTDAKKNIDNWKNMALKYEARLNGYPLEDGKWVRGLIDEIMLDFSNIDSYCLPCKHNKPFTVNLKRI